PDAHPPHPQTPSILESQDSLDLQGIMSNLSYDEDSDSDDIFLDYDAAPCHNHFCPLFQRVAPPFLAATCAVATLATSALLVALAKRPQAWRLGTGPCRLTHLLWHWSLFAQALLVASGSCGTAWARWDPRSRLLAVALWAVALLLATPAALVSGVVSGSSCVRRSVDVQSPAYLLHLTSCLCLLLLLPVGLLVATPAVPRLRVSWRAGGGASWLFLGLWVPYGAGLAGEFLLQARLLEPTCGTFERFDLALGLSEGLGVLHCGLGPLVLLLVHC
ncbi:ACKR1 protein, partial [Menura novaehollandiae]|nr:ACKR1 protein [Menura novaehollandiae]